MPKQHYILFLIPESESNLGLEQARSRSRTFPGSERARHNIIDSILYRPICVTARYIKVAYFVQRRLGIILYIV